MKQNKKNMFYHEMYYELKQGRWIKNTVKECGSNFTMKIRECSTEKGIFERKGDMWASQIGIWWKNVPGSGNRKCRGPEMVAVKIRKPVWLNKA